jgi:hypothetical protein
MEAIRPSRIRNALKHGLTAETVIEPLEDPEEYRVLRGVRVSAANVRRAGARASPRMLAILHVVQGGARNATVLLQKSVQISLISDKLQVTYD